MKHPNPRIQALLDRLANPALSTIDLSLERVARLLDALGNPQDRLPPVVHVAGTNGKGSLVAYLTAIMQAAGYRVHRFTSPHLVRFNEQILLAGKQIEDTQLLALLERVSAETKAHPVTYFEAATAAAFLAFEQTPGDIVLLETGLGGRLDATNMVRMPRLTAITPVSMDHMEYLGNTIAQIAGEKAGIMKASVACVVGPQSEEASRVIENTAQNLRAPLYRFGKNWQVEALKDGFHYRSAKRNDTFPLPNLPGAHQINNAATAIACADQLDDFSITRDHLATGITHAVWPARLDRLMSGTLVCLLPQACELWLDGGHNPAAGAVLAEWVKNQDLPVHLVCGMLSNKDTKEFLKPLVPHVKSLVGIPIEEQKLSQSAEVICATAARLNIKSSVAASAQDAIQNIVKYEKNNFIILICGSLYLVGNILWQNNN